MRRIKTVTVDFPVAEPPPNVYITRHLEVGRLSPAQAMALRLIREAAVAQNIQLRNGKAVGSVTDTVRYMLEIVADSAVEL